MINEQSPKVRRYTAMMADFDAQHSDRICKHYAHAREKHPYFCDWTGLDASKEADVERVKSCLADCRARIEDAIERRNLGWDDLLDSEVWEVFDALVRGDKEQAVEELYDCIAVCLRAIDVLKGRQKLGKEAK